MKHIALLILLFGWAAGGFAKELPVEAFFKRPNFDGVRISPSGDYLAARVEVNGRRTLVVMDRASKQIKKVFNFGNKENQEVGGFGWLNDERVYAQMVIKLGPLDQEAATGYMFAANIDGSKSRQLMPRPKRAGGRSETPYGFSFINGLPDDPEHVMISVWESSFPVVYKLNVYTGTRTRIMRSPVKGGRVFTDIEGEPKIVVGGDIQTVKIYAKSGDSDEWKVFREYATREGGLRPLALSSDGNSVIMRTTKTNVENAIYRLSLTDNKMEKILELDGDAEIEGLIWDNKRKGRELLGFVREPGYIEKTFIAPEHMISQTHKALDNAFKGQYVRIVNYTDDGKLALVSVRSDTNPGELYTLDLEKFKLKFLMKPRDWINPDDMAQMKPFAFTARDGKEIRGYLTMPKGMSKNAPLVTLVHGGPYGVKDSWQFHPEVQFLANRGYAVMQVNYRGSGGRGSDYQYSAYRQMGREMQDDVTDGALWAVKQGLVDKDRMCIYGASYGGYAALYGVVKDPDLYKCAIGYVGVYDIAIQTKLSDTATIKDGRKFLEDAWNAYDDDFVRERSALYHVDKIKAALFLVHGDDDQRVPVENVHALTDALDDRGYPYELMIKNREGHGFRNEENNFELYNKLAAFLDKHIGG